MNQTIEIMDTTLRDGEQTDGVSFSGFEKKQIARLLLEQLRVDRIEIASARVSDGEQKVVTEIFQWAEEKGHTDRIEILGFTDHRASVDWIRDAGGRAVNLLTKGSRRHCEEQLRKSLAEHLVDVEKTISYAADQGFRVNVYLEDWSNGYLNSPDYVREMLRALREMPVHRILLPDTLGIMGPQEVKDGIDDCLQHYPDLDLDFHGHNDYDLATANCMAAVRAGVKGLHMTVNGLGERAGNAPLEAVVTCLHDKVGVRTNVNEKAFNDVSRLVATFSGKRVSANTPVVGQDVYTQTAGIHADGDKKNNLYANPILPERFGRERVYALGKLAGRASVANNLKMLGIELSPEREKQLLARVVELGEKKNIITADDLPFLIEDLFGSSAIPGGTPTIRIKDAVIHTVMHGEPSAEIELEYRGTVHREKATGDGGYDAFMNALRTIAEKINLTLPVLADYELRIPPGRKTDALVQTVITWRIPTTDGGDSEGNERAAGNWVTVGVDSDQMTAAIKATEKMLNRLVVAEGERTPLSASRVSG